MSSTNKPIIVIVDGVIGAGKSTLLKKIVPIAGAHAKVFLCREPVDEWESSGFLEKMYAANAAIAAEQAEEARRKIADSETESCCGSDDDASSSGSGASPDSTSSRSITPLIASKSAASPYVPSDGMPGSFQIYAFSTRIATMMPIYREASSYAQEHPFEKVIVIAERSVFTDRAVFKHMLVEAGFINTLMADIYEKCWEAWRVACEAPNPDLCVFVDTTVDAGIERIKRRNRHGEESIDRAYATALWKRHQELFVDETTFEGAPVVRVDGAEPFHDNHDVALKITRRILTAAGVL